MKNKIPKTLSFLLLLAGIFFLPTAYAQEKQECQITNCHGLEIECGFSGPLECTMMYQLGDFCQQFAECQVVEGQCRLVTNEVFERCKTCAQNCNQDKDPMKAFECESACREEFGTNLNNSSDQ